MPARAMDGTCLAKLVRMAIPLCCAAQAQCPRVGPGRSESFEGGFELPLCARPHSAPRREPPDIPPLRCQWPRRAFAELRAGKVPSEGPEPAPARCCNSDSLAHVAYPFLNEGVRNLPSPQDTPLSFPLPIHKFWL